MNYELAKQLKDAGFPQHGGENPREGDSYIPTLSELIEACGEMFELSKTAPERGSLKARWVALAWPHLFDSNTIPLQSIGDTPEEAVAKLWLELNKK